MGDSDVEVVQAGMRAGYEGFFRITVRTLSHRRFDGSMSPVLTREIFERGDAAAVLPYDPVRDEVLLIRQFLPGAWAGGHAPRPLQAVAGMVDKSGEDAEGVARREAGEEAGVTVGRVVAAQAFLPSPGGSSERIETFVAEADLAAAGGIHGLAEEHEDIRVEVMPAEEAIARLDRGEIEAGPAVVLLLWFARHRDRLRREWGGAGTGTVTEIPSDERDALLDAAVALWPRPQEEAAAPSWYEADGEDPAIIEAFRAVVGATGLRGVRDPRLS